MNVVPLAPSQRAWAAARVAEHFGSARIVTRGRVLDTGALPGLVALEAGEPAGLAHLAIRGAECEIVTLVAVRPRSGIGRALLDAAAGHARAAGCPRLVAVTTNDNVAAQRFYAACGFALVATRRGAVTRARELKPEIPRLGEAGVPIEDELEYARDLESGR